MSDTLAFVYNVYTDESHRRRGIARLVMDTIHAWCRERGVGSLFLALAAVVRFFHFALFEEPFLSLSSYAVDFATAFAAATLGYRTVRAHQMRTQYGWLMRASGPLGWRRA